VRHTKSFRAVLGKWWELSTSCPYPSKIVTNPLLWSCTRYGLFSKVEDGQEEHIGCKHGCPGRVRQMDIHFSLGWWTEP
jgi:hypothetical protein